MERYSNNMNKCVEKVSSVFLEEYLLFQMQEKLQSEEELKRFYEEAEVKLEGEVREQKKKREIQEKKIQKLKHENIEAYQEYVLGKTEIFCSNDKEIKMAEKELSEINKTLEELEKSYIEIKNKKECLSAEGEYAVLSKEMLDKYIEKIVVYDEQNIEICWK